VNVTYRPAALNDIDKIIDYLNRHATRDTQYGFAIREQIV
jgi:plasmid stabilization system protein ParE